MKLEDRVGLCYGSISLFSTVLHNVFLIYHIETFVSIYKIDKTSFWTGEMIFLIWNSLNDPLFGWLADSKQGATSLPSDISYTAQSTNLSHGLKTSTHIIVKRITVIRWCGPMMALSFATFWFDWNIPCVQFAICLCLYDTFLSLIDLQQSALLADLSITVQARANMTSYEAAFSAAGSISVFLSYQVWDRGNLIPFQTLCILLAVISAIGFYVISTFLQSFISIPGHNTNYISNKDGVVPHNLSLKVYIRQLLAQKNFLRFTLINAIQVFHCHFNSNFLAVFMEVLIADHKHYGTFLIGISFVIPHLNNILFLRLCKHYGIYSVIRLLFAAKMVLALLMLYCGVSYGWLMCFFIASNRVCTEGTCRLLTLVIADLVDEDYVKNSRSAPISMLLFGTVNFLAKPSQTLAPIVGTSLLSILSGYEMFSIEGERSPLREHTNIYKESCFQLLVYVPLVCGALQMFIWSFFKLRGGQLQRIKSARLNLQYMIAV
ncbi:transmembrane protein 180-like isoform X2 [Watersipora subatra]